MIHVSSTKEMTSALLRARRISLAAYQLPYGNVLNALEAAAGRGARVEVRLEGRPFPDRCRRIVRHNARVVAELRRCGADARLVDRDGRVPLHAKAARIDGVLYVDDVNFAENGTILRLAPDPARMAWSKQAALDLEARALESARDGGLDVETESIGGTKIYGDLCRRAREGSRARLLISRGALTPKERPWLQRLERSGVEVRTCGANEKLALAGARAWVGSGKRHLRISEKRDGRLGRDHA